LKHGALRGIYVVLAFTLDNLDSISASLRYEVAPEAIRCMGGYIDKHFGALGGFSTRQSANEFATVLPNADLAEVEGILEGFTKDLQQQGIHDIQAAVSRREVAAECVDFVIFVGLAQGQPGVELESIITLAKNHHKEIARLRCDTGSKTK
jgi:phospholipid/cholesterol/gamma-HCH transport system ATP-binding protein